METFLIEKDGLMLIIILLTLVIYGCWGILYMKKLNK